MAVSPLPPSLRPLSPAPRVDAVSSAAQTVDGPRGVAHARAPEEEEAAAPAARACVIVPAFQAERTLAVVVRGLRAHLPTHAGAIFVVDDGSTDATARVATELGCAVVGHGNNRGKGAALRTGFATARAHGFDVALTVDADGQHPASAARDVMDAGGGPDALVLGVRDLRAARAPRANQLSNGISNYFLSRFAGTRLRDTQCGLRRYPIRRTLELGARADGYDFEAEILLRAVWKRVTVVEHPIEVLYPADRVTHFDSVRDPMRIIRTVVGAVASRSASR